jgi:hypothetical protein
LERACHEPEVTPNLELSIAFGMIWKELDKNLIVLATDLEEDSFNQPFLEKAPFKLGMKNVMSLPSDSFKPFKN